MNPESLTPLTFGLLLHRPQLLHSDKSLKELFTKLGTVHEFTQYEQPGEGSASFVRLSRSKQERFACFFYSDRVEIVHDNPSSGVKGFWRVVQDILKESVRALQIPAFLRQQYLIRKTANPFAELDARWYLLHRH